MADASCSVPAVHWALSPIHLGLPGCPALAMLQGCRGTRDNSERPLELGFRGGGSWVIAPSAEPSTAHLAVRPAARC